MQKPYLNMSNDELIKLVEKLESENSDFKGKLSNHQIITNTIDETFWLSDFQNRKVLYVSPSYERMFGMSLESLYDDPSSWEKYIHPEDKARIRNAFNKKIPTNTYDEEFRIVKEDGVVQWVRDRAFPVSDENGDLKLIAGTTQYITKAKEAEFRLKETTENLIQIMETIPSGILIIDQNYKTVFINKFLMNILALSKEDVYVENILKILNKGFFDELKDRIQDIYEKHKTKSEEVNFINFINEEFWVDIKATSIHFNGQECILVTVNDITKLKIAQHAVLNSRKNIFALINNTQYALILLNREKKIITYNSAAYELFNFLTELNLMKKASIKNYFSDIEYERFEKEFNRALNNEKVIFEKEYYLHDGDSFWIEERYHPAKSEEGEIFGVNYSLINITERKKIEKELQDSKAHLKAIFDSSSELNIFSLDKNLKYTAFNGQHAFKMHQLWNRDIELGMSIMDVVTDQYAKEKLNINFERALKGEEFTNIETFRNTDDKIYYENTYSPIFYDQDDIEGIVVIVRDISEKIHNQKKLENSEQALKKLNSNKDKFFSIIAHDLKAPLSGFIGLSNELSNNADFLASEDIKNLAISMNDSAKNIYQLLENLLEWSRTITGQKQINIDNLNPYLITETLVGLFKDVAKNKNVIIENQFEKDKYLIGDANMFTTILRNLVSNSLKFTQDGSIFVGMTKEGTMAQVFVKDTGVGMKEEIKAKLFRIDQNVTELGTNKEKGTGLGLILCKEFVEKNNGHIWVESEIRKGTTFYFTFPLVD